MFVFRSTMSYTDEHVPLLSVPEKVRGGRVVGAKRAGAVILCLGIALFALAGQTSQGAGAVLQAASGVSSRTASFAPRVFAFLGGGGDIAAARKAREAASADFAAKQQKALEASDAAAALEAAAVAAESDAVAARDAAVTSRVQSLDARVDTAHASASAVSGRTADAQDAAAEAARDLVEAKATYYAAKDRRDAANALVTNLKAETAGHGSAVEEATKAVETAQSAVAAAKKAAEKAKAKAEQVESEAKAADAMGEETHDEADAPC